LQGDRHPRQTLMNHLDIHLSPVAVPRAALPYPLIAAQVPKLRAFDEHSWKQKPKIGKLLKGMESFGESQACCSSRRSVEGASPWSPSVGDVPERIWNLGEGRKKSMKVASVIRILACSIGLAAVGASGAYAQSEIDPDHFESPSVEPFDTAEASASGDAGDNHYDGKFSLPYAVQRNGKSLRSGKYSVSLHSSGKVSQAILNHKGEAVGVAGLIPKQERKRGNDALVVKQNGKTHRLSAIQVAELKLVFDRALQVESSSGNTPTRTERLPLTVMDPRK
jgi:hypothetical protein